MTEPTRVRAATVELYVWMSHGRRAIARYVLFETPTGEPESVMRVVTEIPPLPCDSSPEPEA